MNSPDISLMEIRDFKGRYCPIGDKFNDYKARIFYNQVGYFFEVLRYLHITARQYGDIAYVRERYIR